MKDNVYSKNELKEKLHAFIDAIEGDSEEVFTRRLHSLILMLKRYESMLKRKV